MGTKCSLNGWTIRGAFSWELRAGTAPVMAVADVGDEGAAALLGENAGGQGKTGGILPVTLRMGISGKNVANAVQDFKGLYVVGEVPRMSPNQGRRVIVADRRWLWSRAYYYKSFNVTRKVGTKRLGSPGQVIENSTLDADVAYAPWSLIGRNLPWTAKTLLESLGAAIEAAEKDNGLQPPVVHFGQVAQAIDGTPIQDLTLDGQLDECIERALAYLPGVAVRLNQDGSIGFFDTADSSEKKIVLGGYEIVGRGHAQQVSFARERPSKIRVLFSINAELRFDYVEDQTYAAAADDSYCENVAPVPDPYVTVGGERLVEGTWVPLQSLYDCSEWSSLPNGTGKLTSYAVRRAMVPFMDFWSGILTAGKLVSDADWASRVGVVQQNYRQTFQINRRWMDRIREFRIGRVGTLNPTTGVYGKAPVYSDYAYLPSQRSQYVESQGSTETAWIVNVAAWPSGGTITASTRAAAADLEMVDHDQGVVRINFLADRFRIYEQALPSQVECDGDDTQPGVSPTNPGPRQNISGFSTRPCGWNFVGAGEKPPVLCGNDRKAFIVSAVPATPNDKSGLVAIDILPTSDGIPAFPGKSDCAGPIMEIRIAPSVEVARIPWTDTNADTIRQFFTRSSAAPQLGIDEIRNLCINASGSPEQGASLEGIAQGVAAAVWVSLRDRVVGSKETVFSPASRPTGNLSAVTHTLAPDTGAITTGYSLPDRIQPLDVSRYLPESVKRFINRIVNPGA